MHLTTITRPSLPTRLTTIGPGHYVHLPIGAAPKPITKPMPSRPTRFLPADSDLLDTLHLIATSDRPPTDYLSRVHGIDAAELQFLSRQGLITLSDGRVYVTDSGLSELSA
jgi:hypothetical protein